MILIVGLGNPGKKFQKTRHNLGFTIVNKIQAVGEKFLNWKFEKKFQAEISQGKINNQKIILAKPQIFMNNSGKSVKLIIKNYRLKIENLYVVHDDLDLPLGKIRIVKNRGSAGHKGVQSIIDQLKTKDFIRFRIGIKPKNEKKINREKFVLEKFKKNEEKIIKKIIKKTVEAIKFALKEGLEKAMTKYNY
jgi:PTH1 family peptidyl-tRNA hydrolase